MFSHFRGCCHTELYKPQQLQVATSDEGTGHKKELTNPFRKTLQCSHTHMHTPSLLKLKTHLRPKPQHSTSSYGTQVLGPIRSTWSSRHSICCKNGLYTVVKTRPHTDTHTHTGHSISMHQIRTLH